MTPGSPAIKGLRMLANEYFQKNHLRKIDSPAWDLVVASFYDHLYFLLRQI